MKILYITMEYHHQFSGNGTASISFVRALRALGDEVFVVCGGAAGDPRELAPEDGVCVPVGAGWGHHGRTGPWEEWGRCLEGTTLALPFVPDVVIGVDWEANRAYEHLVRCGAVTAAAPFVYYNYRVFHRNTGNTAADTAFYTAKERESCALAQGRVLCLCESDKQALVALTDGAVTPVVLLPGLRNDMRATAGAASTPRRFLLCCVRIIPEKNVRLFVELVRNKRLADTLRARGVVPYLVGSAASRDYGNAVKADLLAAFPESMTSDFVSAQELQHIMRQSVLNVHPALNEAYGMTIVEAAAVGCCSIVHDSDIGATSLLEPAQGEVYTTDMHDASAVACRVADLISDADALADTAARAKAKALSYGERENAEELRRFLAGMAAAL